MYLLSEPHGGRRPTTSGRPETLEIMCNLIFTQNKRRWMDREAPPQKGQKNGRPSRTGPSPKDLGHFLLKPLKAIVLCLIPLTPLTLVLMVFWPWTVDAEKRLCRSSCVSLTPFLSFSYFTSVSFTDSSILSQPFSV